MSNFNQLKSMWESQSKKDTVVPPPPKLPEKFKTPIVRDSAQTSQLSANQSQRASNQTANRVEIDTQSSKLSVSDLTKNLQGNLKLGQANPRATQYQNSSNQYKVEEPVVEPKRDPKDIIPVKGSERMPTFQQSKQQIRMMFQKKKNQKQGYPTGPATTPTPNQTIIDLKKQQNDYSKLTPEERTEQVMKRVFSAPEPEPQSSLNPFAPETHQNNSMQMHSSDVSKRQTFLQQHEEANSLNLRGAQKKEKKSLGNFDDDD